MRNRFFIIIIYLFIFNALHAQNENISLLGRWGRGPSQTVFKRGNFVFVGSGAYLQAYQNRLGVYDIRDEILLPGNIEDIWVNSDTTHIYLACGNEGLQVVYFNHKIRQFAKIIGHHETPGYASGLMHYGSHVYLADGEEGFTIFDVSIPSSPVQKGTYHTDGYAHDVWVKNNSSAFVAAGEAGLYSIGIQNVNTPVLQDVIQFPTIYEGKPAPEVYNVITIADTAYIAAGYGGLRFVNVSNPTSIAGKEISYWTNGGVGVDVRNLWVSGDYAYLACGDDGVISHINVSNVSNPLASPYPAFKNDGSAASVVVDHDTAYVAYGSGGHLLVNVEINNAPELIKSFAGSDKIYDVELNDYYLFTAAGASGVNIFDLEINDPPQESLTPVATYNTAGGALALKNYGIRLFVADGTQGVTVLNVFNPLEPALEKSIAMDGDTCFQVDVSTQHIFAACGTAGIRVYQYPGDYNELSISPVDIGSPVYSLKYKDNRLYAATNAGVQVFDFSSQVSFQNSFAELQTDSPAKAVDTIGDKVFVANGEQGMILWNMDEDEQKTIATGGSCEDLVVTDKNVFTAESDSGIAIYDYTSQDDIVKVAYYESNGDARRIGISPDTRYIGVADQINGLHVLSNEIRPLISITPTDIDFGPVPLNYSRSIKINVANPGTAELVIDSFEIAGNTNAFSFAATSFSVPPGGVYKLAITFNPKSGDDLTHNTVVDIHSNSDIVRLTLTGKSSVLVNDGPYDTDDFTAGLWHFNENDAAVSAADASSNGLTGTLKGGATRGASKDGFSRALVLNGSNAWVEIPKTPYLNFSDSPFAAECFFSLAEKPQGSYVLIARGSGNTLQYEMGIGEDTERGIKGLYAWINDQNGNAHIISYDLLRDIQLNYWYHSAMTWDSDSLKLYLNGSLVAEDAFSGTLKDEDVVTTVGSDPIGTKPFKGMIDEVRISSINRENWEYHVNRSRMVVDADTLHFGNVPVSQERTLSFTVQNDGSQTLTISSIIPPNDYIDITPDNFYLEPNARQIITVTFQPTETISMKTGSYLTIESTDPTFPQKTIVIQGQGLTAIDPGAYSAADDPYTIGLWHFDERVENNQVPDESPYHNNGYLKGDASLSENIRKFDEGQALYCNGADDLFWIPMTHAPQPGKHWEGFTIEGWFYPTGLPQEGHTALLLRRGSSTNYQFQITVGDDGKLHGQIMDASEEVYSITFSTETIAVNKWYHFALKTSEDSLSMIVNGLSSKRTAISGDFFSDAFSQDTLSIRVGNNIERSEPFQGYIDEVRMSNIGREVWEFNVVDSRLEISATSLNFGDVLEGESRTLLVNLMNAGSDSLKINNITSSNPSVFTVSIAALPLKLAPSGTVNMAVTFYPVEPGELSEHLIIQSDDPFWPSRMIYLNGNGVEQSSVGQYETDAQTLELLHFSSTDELDFGVRPVAWSDSGRFGEALRIRKGGWVNIPMSSNLSLASSGATFEFWFFMREIPAVNANSTLFRWGGKESNWVHMYYHNDEGVGEINTVFSNGQAVSVPVPDFHLYQWYHLALTWDGDSLRFYLNKKNKLSESAELDLNLSAAAPFFMGASDSLASNPFVGSFDELRLSNIERKSWEYNVLSPKIYVNPSSLNFSEVLKNQSRILYFAIKNQGDQDLTVGEMSINEPAFTISPSAGFTLPRLKSKTISVTFQPTVNDTSYNNPLILTSNDPAASIKTITLMGQSVKARTYSAFDDEDPNTLVLYHFDKSDIDTTNDFQVVLTDRSENGKTGYIQGAASKNDGLFGSDALHFDGKNDYVILNSHQDFIFDMLTESFSIEFSFMTDTLSGQQTLVSKGVRDTVYYQIALDRYGHVTIPKFGTTTQYFNDGKWHQLAFLYHPTDTTFLYVDGEQVLSKKLFKFSNNDKGRPILLGAAENLPNSQYNFYNGAIDEFRISSVLRSAWEIAPPEYNISVQSTPSLAVYNQDLTIQIQVPLEMDILSAMIYYRPGGGSLYYDSLAAYGIGTNKEATIPAADVTARGLEYYIRVVDKEGFAYLKPSVEPKNNPISIPVFYADLVSEWTFYNQTVYNAENERKSVQKTTLMSIPFETEAAAVDTLFEEMLPYDPFEWRLFWWHAKNSQTAMANGTDPVYYEYPVDDPNIFKFTEPVEIRLGGAQTKRTDEMATIQLNPGWNLIANPFNFPVKWADCSNSSASLINYAVSWDEDGYHYDVKRLDPWKGYWVHNPDTLIATLAIPPKAADVSTSVSKELASEETETLQPGEWNIQFSVGNNTVKDTYNLIGARTAASDERDSFDRLECPPGFGEWLSLSFDHDDWKNYGGAYTADIRPAGKEGYRWIMDIDAMTSSDQLDLSWTVQNLPSDFEAYLLDPVTQTSTNLLSKTDREVPGKASRQLTILVGTREYIDANRDGIELTPITFHLDQNYPNPFNPETAIRYSVPQLDNVELMVFNILGQKISTLKNDRQSPGHYEIIWNGLNDYGVRMASGVYIYRLKIGEKVATKKMLLVR